MRSLLILVLVCLTAALPIRRVSPTTVTTTTLTSVSSMQSSPGVDLDTHVIDFDLGTAHTRLAINPILQHGRLESPLVFELNVKPTRDILTSNVTVNQQPLLIKWDTTDDQTAFFATVAAPNTQFLTIEDRQGHQHSVELVLGGFVETDSSHPYSRRPSDTQHLSIQILSIDNLVPNHFAITIISRPTTPENLLVKIYRTSDMRPAAMSATLPNMTTTDTVPTARPFTMLHQGEDTLDIEAEIEALLLLEAEAGDLSAQIAAKKHSIAKCLKNHRDQVSLRHLLRECDGVVCAAKVLAQRICDKVGILTEPNFRYVPVEEVKPLLDLDDDVEKVNVTISGGKVQAANVHSTKSDIHFGNRYFNLHTNGAAVTQSVDLVYPQNVLLQVLGIIAGALGLTALFRFLRRKCMSARSKVDRLAEREERRNARAYRRAARRADMRRRWDAFMTAISCFGSGSDESQCRIENYEEKRALILQDAFLEQDLDSAEKGEVMEAEIRELRNANYIVAGLVGVDESRRDLPRRPPRQVQMVSGRSRASTATLPSYTSDILPDYRSRMSISIPSSSSGISSRSTVFSPTEPRSVNGANSTNPTGSPPRSNSPEGSEGSEARRTRYTPTSSVIEVSPRCSVETLRTSEWRRSLALSRRSGAGSNA